MPLAPPTRAGRKARRRRLAASLTASAVEPAGGAEHDEAPGRPRHSEFRGFERGEFCEQPEPSR